jgi:hypothetical protein
VIPEGRFEERIDNGDAVCGAAATDIVRAAFEVSTGELESVAVTPKE